MATATKINHGLLGIARFYGHFLPTVRKHTALVAKSLLLLIVGVLLSILEPWPLKFAFDFITGRTSNTLNFPWLQNLFSNNAMLALGIVAISLVIITGLRAMITYISTIGFALVGNKVLIDIRNQLFDRLQSLSLNFHTKSKSGDLVIRLMSDIGMMKEVLVTALLPLFGSALVFVGILALMFYLDWQFALLICAILPISWLLVMNRGRKIQHIARINKTREGNLASTAIESVSAIKTVQSLSLQDTFSDQFMSVNNKGINEGVKIKRLTASLERSIDMLIVVCLAVILWFGSYRVITNALSPGDLLLFLFYSKKAFRPLKNLVKYSARISKASAAGERVLEIFETSPEVVDKPDAKIVNDIDGAITFEHVTFHYEQGNASLSNVNFSILPQQRVAIVGPSGAGKTTITNLILRLYDPSHGRVLIDDTDIRDYQVASWRKNISIVLQDGLLFRTTIRDNIAYGLENVSEDAIIQAAKLANADEFIQELPDGYNTMIGERGATLSNGQRQRISIARAAMRDSSIVILDEPTTGLDERNEQLVINALNKLCEKRTTIFITHDILNLEVDRILYLANGELIEDGTHEELLLLNKKYAELYKLKYKNKLPQSKVAQYAFSR